MNILLLSVGTRNKVVQYFKKELKEYGKVIATDMSELAPAIYEADKYYIVKSIHDDKYLDDILEICKTEKITGVLSLIDPELSLLAKNSSKFKEIGTTVIGSPYTQCEISLDKYQMFEWLQSNGYKCAKTYIDKNLFYKDLDANIISFPVFVKPNKGSASISISKVYDKKTLELLLSHSSDLLIQEYLKGQEIGADVYIDMISGETVSIFTKKKLKMRAGETDKAVSFKDEKLFSLIKKFSHAMGYKAQIDIDIFDINGDYYISEVNPRFGGGYPHAHEANINHIKLILNNLSGNDNLVNIGNYDENIFMMKYNEILVINNQKC